MLTLAQTHKLDRRLPIVLYGRAFWTEVLDLGALERHGMISREDLSLLQYADDPATALAPIQSGVEADRDEPTPAFAHSRARHPGG
jgi:predicted Rossmann-fold nucleotide-binding protein